MKRQPDILFLKLLTVLLTVTLISCSGIPKKLEKNQLTDKFDKSPVPKVEFDNFWEYMESFEFNIPSQIHYSKEQKIFSDGLKLIELGNFDSAEKHFRRLYTSTNDSSVYKNSKKALVDVLFHNSKWQDLVELDSAETAVPSPDNSLRLADAFRKANPERIFFPDHLVSMPIYISPTGCPIIEVYINGERRFFWLDTGANYSVISSDIAQELEIFPISYLKAKALTGTVIKVDVYPAVIDSIDIAGVKLYNHPTIIVHDFNLKFKFFGTSNITKIDGIIGWKAIQNMDITIDYKNLRLAIQKPVEDSSSVRNMFWMGCPVIRLKNDEGIPLLFGLDLGAEKTTITSNIFNKVNFEKIYSVTKQLGSLGGWVFNNSRMISSLTLDFGSELMHFQDIGTGYQQKKLFVKLDGILGTDFMRDGKIRINCPSGIFEFSVE